MKAFEFRLQRIAEIWQKEAEASREQLQTLLNEIQKIAAARAALESEQEEERAILASKPNLTGLDLLSFSQFQSYVGRRVKEIEQQKVKVQAKIEAQRLVVLEAERKVKLLERLRERKLQDWKLECDRELENLASDSHLARLAASASASRALGKAALTL